MKKVGRWSYVMAALAMGSATWFKSAPALSLVALLLLSGVTWAGKSTHTGTGSENSEILFTGPSWIHYISACNYNTTGAETVMVFDSPTSVSNGAEPDLPRLALAAAASATQPTCGVMALPETGVQMSKGAWIACSTTPKTLTVDTTSGGNCAFWAER